VGPADVAVRTGSEKKTMTRRAIPGAWEYARPVRELLGARTHRPLFYFLSNLKKDESVKPQTAYHSRSDTVRAESWRSGKSVNLSS